MTKQGFSPSKGNISGTSIPYSYLQLRKEAMPLNYVASSRESLRLAISRKPDSHTESLTRARLSIMHGTELCRLFSLLTVPTLNSSKRGVTSSVSSWKKASGWSLAATPKATPSLYKWGVTTRYMWLVSLASQTLFLPYY